MNYAQVVDICCRDLRRYLEYALLNTRGHVVTVKMRRLLRAELTWPDRIRYSRCLSRILRRWRWGDAYVIPRQDASELLETFDALCESIKHVKPRSRPKPRRPKEEMVFISFTLPNDLAHALDSYAQRIGAPRSAVIRQAIQQLIDMRNALEEIDKARNGPLHVVAFRLPKAMLDALNQRVASLKATRAALIRYAIHEFINRMKESTLAP
jgi:metal-responsive CopG/Arc/MetJ family transcriptional regulator